MAFTLYQSNRQEDLFTLFATVLAQRQDQTILQPDRVIIPSQGMAKWLNLGLAEKLGIAANIHFELPAAFIWSCIRAYRPEVPSFSPFQVDVLTWRIYQLLSEKDWHIPMLASYLKGDNNLKKGQFARILAILFDQYLVYRPDWVLAWENQKTLNLGEDEWWQAQIWQALTKEKSTSHRATLLQHLIDQCLVDPSHLPPRLLCFGVTHLAPMYFSLLQKLGDVVDVHYFVFNPSRENWVGDRDVREQLRIAGEKDPETLYLHLGHPLLSSWGKPGRDFFATLSDLPTIDVFPVDQELHCDTLLKGIQADIVRAQAPAQVYDLHTDDSICVASCHGPMREVEVLYDAILHWLAKDPSLEPADILVLAPDIEVYVPYIDAVFAASSAPVYLPYGITDKNPLQHSALFSLFLELLTLPLQRFDVEWVLDIIRQPIILRRFGLTISHIPLLENWVRALNIHWGRDAQHRAQYQIFDNGAYSWREGLDRLLLAAILPNDMAGNTAPLFANYFAPDTIALNQRQILTSFVSLIETLIDYAEQLAQKRTATTWIDILFALIDSLFLPDEKEEKEILSIQHLLATLREEMVLAELSAIIAIDFLADSVRKRLESQQTQRGFLGRGLTFCHMVPLRTLPARIICVLGLNHDAFPRQSTTFDIDLMRQYPRTGDRARLLDDRYLFLETLCSARERLYLSYIGQDIKTNHTLPPSVLVDELLDVIDQYGHSDVSARECIVTRHALQPFDGSYFYSTKLPSFQTLWFNVAQANVATKVVKPDLFFGPLSEPFIARIEVEALLAFYRHPMRFLLQQRLGIRLPWMKEPPFLTDVFSVDKKKRLHIRQRLMQYPDYAASLLQAERVLPLGVFGELPFSQEALSIEAYRKSMHDLRPLLPLSLGSFFLNHWQIEGNLPSVSKELGIILSSLYDTPRPVDRITGWIQHLLLCVKRPQAFTLHTMVTGVLEGYQYVACTMQEAEAYLTSWLRYFKLGQSQPLPFFPKTSLCFAEQIHQGKSIAQAKVAAAKVFLPGELYWGEGNDRYVEAIYRTSFSLDQDFVEIAQALLLPMLSYQKAWQPGGLHAED